MLDLLSYIPVSKPTNDEVGKAYSSTTPTSDRASIEDIIVVLHSPFFQTWDKHLSYAAEQSMLLPPSSLDVAW